jgi:receptor-type tyrosine-protein phosphatase gamma
LQKKCDRYWPSVDCETYGMFEASLAKEEVMANYTVRTLKLKHTKVKTREILFSVF